jgi:hypothetical protein
MHNISNIINIVMHAAYNKKKDAACVIYLASDRITTLKEENIIDKRIIETISKCSTIAKYAEIN